MTSFNTSAHQAIHHFSTVTSSTHIVFKQVRSPPHFGSSVIYYCSALPHLIAIYCSGYHRPGPQQPQHQCIPTRADISTLEGIIKGSFVHQNWRLSCQLLQHHHCDAFILLLTMSSRSCSRLPFQWHHSQSRRSFGSLSIGSSTRSALVTMTKDLPAHKWLQPPLNQLQISSLAAIFIVLMWMLQFLLVPQLP